MKKLVIAFLILIITIPVSNAQVQMFGKYTHEGRVEPDINIFGYAGPKTSKVKLSYFSLVEKSWAEGLVGVSYSPFTYLELGLMGGIETSLPAVPNGAALYRGAGSLWMGNDKISFYTCFEKGEGKGDWWYKSTAGYSLDKKLSLGLMSWRYNGTGVFFKHTEPESGISIWVNPAYDLEFKEKRITVGIDIKI